MSPGRSAGAADWLVASDLDGTLLDERTYAFAGAANALALIIDRRIPLVLCSSKTRAEMTPLGRSLGAQATLAVENGGALVLPPDLFPRAVTGVEQRNGDRVVPLGTPHGWLVEALQAIARETGAGLVPFSSLTADELESLTGLTGEEAARARAREFDEPFLMADAGHAPAVAEAAERRGLQVTRGGRFFHLTGRTDKGRALRAVLDLYAAEGRRFTTVGLGDSANDLSMLQAVYRPIVVPRPGGVLDEALAAALPSAERAPEPGPSGWNAAVITVLEGGHLPSVASALAAAERP